jgi:hypothetical protein
VDAVSDVKTPPAPSVSVTATPLNTKTLPGSGTPAHAVTSAPGPSTPPVNAPPPTTGSGMRRMLDDIDQSFENILSHPPPPGTNELTQQELAEAQRLFLEISSTYLGPVRDLMMEVELGEPSKEWLSICRPAVASLRRAASDMMLEGLAEGLGGMLAAIEHGERGPGNVLDPKSREALRSAYEKLVLQMPEAFSTREDRDRREPVIVQSLLRQVPEVRKVALDRLFSAGLIGLEMYYKAKPSDLAETAGISRELAERIVARFQRYKRELASMAPNPQRSREKSHLETLTKKLEEQNAAFEASARSFSNNEDKRRLRQERAATILEVNLVLARLGDVGLVEKLERLPFQRKAEELRSFLASRKE